MIKSFDTIENFGKTYEFYMSDEGMGIYLNVPYEYPKQSFLNRLFNGKLFVNRFFNENEKHLCDSYYLARVINVTWFNITTSMVDIDWIDQNGNMRVSKVLAHNLHHIDFGSYENTKIDEYNKKKYGKD